MSRLPEATSFPVSMPVHDVALWPSLGRWTTAALVALGVWTAGTLFSPAHANGVNWSFGVNVPGGAVLVSDYRPPVAVYSAPVYPAVSYPVYPAPVYAPPVRVYEPAPWGYAPPPRHHRHHHHPERYPDGRHWDDGRGGWDRR